MMRRSLALSLSISMLACTPAQRNDAGSSATAGSTTTSPGTPTVIRSDTTRANDSVTFTLDRQTYRPGAPVIMRITSHVRETLGFNACSSRSVQRQQGESWAAVPEPGKMCTMELRLLSPNQTQDVNTQLPRDVTTGTHRIVLTFGRQSTAPAGAPADWGTVRAVSPSFRVE